MDLGWNELAVSKGNNKKYRGFYNNIFLENIPKSMAQNPVRLSVSAAGRPGLQIEKMEKKGAGGSFPTAATANIQNAVQLGEGSEGIGPKGGQAEIVLVG